MNFSKKRGKHDELVATIQVENLECICSCEFHDKILLKEEECKTQVNLNFSKKQDKHSELVATIQVENLEFFYISDDETDLTIEFFLQNLIT